MQVNNVNMSLDEIIAGKAHFCNKIKARRSGATKIYDARSAIVERRWAKLPNQGSNDVVPRSGIIKRSPKRIIAKGNIEAILKEGGVAKFANEGRLLISNLHFKVRDDNMIELFSKFGALKKAAVNYDISGKSLGTAEVIFTSKQNARRAVATNNMELLYGRPMQIQMIDNFPEMASKKNIYKRVGKRHNPTPTESTNQTKRQRRSEKKAATKMEKEMDDLCLLMSRCSLN